MSLLSAGGRSVQFARLGLVAAWSAYLLVLAAAGNEEAVPWEDHLYHGVLLLAAGLLAWRATEAFGSARTAWALFAAGVVSWTVGDTYYTFVASQGVLPFPSPADIGWLAFHVCVFPALVLLARQAVPRLRWTLLLDGILGGLGAAALGALVIGPVLATAQGTLLETAVLFAYPVADVVLLALLVTLAGVQGWRLSRMWLGVTIGLAVFAAGEVKWLVANLTGDYVDGSLWDATWITGLVLVALAAWSRDTVRPPRDVPVLAVPVAVSLIAVGINVLALYHAVSQAAVFLAAATTLAVLARLSLSLSEIRRLLEASHEAVTDELTELGNRRLLYRALDALLGRSPQPECALLLLDLDRFKEINDALGHHVGDELLRQLGPRLTRTASQLHPPGLVTRLGGDEFAVLLEGPEARYSAMRAAEDLTRTVGQPFLLDGLTVQVNCSIGISLAPDHGVDRSTLLRCADIAMYRAKKDGTGRHSLYQHGGKDLARYRLGVLEDLRLALGRNELCCEYQPQMDLRTGEIAGVEALVRWRHPRRGLLGPTEFIPLVEQAGLMHRLTEIVLGVALQQCRSWLDEGLRIPLAVNISVSNLLDSHLPDTIRLILGQNGLEASMLEVEITESVLMSDPGRALATLERLERIGVTASVDDYGTGYSSLAYLRSLPLHGIKLDRMFVVNLTTDQRMRAIVNTTADLAHGLGLRMVAEGVETEADLAELARLGCDMAQGFHLARPMPGDEVVPWVRNHARAMAAVVPEADKLA